MKVSFAPDFFQSKTTALAVTTILGAIGAVAAHQATPKQAIAAALFAVFQAFQRDATVKAAAAK